MDLLYINERFPAVPVESEPMLAGDKIHLLCLRTFWTTLLSTSLFLHEAREIAWCCVCTVPVLQLC